MSIADNLKRVRERIAAAAELAGRGAEQIKLVGVTKYVGPDVAAKLAAAGCHDLGESRPQELWNKFDALHDMPVHWHLVGHLQRNKVRRTLPIVALIHSVDNQRLLAAIDEARSVAEATSPIKVLLEINTSGEAVKHGLYPDEVEQLLATAPRYPRVAVRGLMTMAALEGGETVAARNFAALRELKDRLIRVAPSCVQLDELSMGMSADFEVAIREGATIVRIGSLLWH